MTELDFSTQEKMEAEYREMLNAEGTVKVSGCTFDRADILKELDPIAYRMGLLQYMASFES